MKIHCPQCSTPYALADGSIGAEGRMVRCARCGTPWRAFPAEDIKELGADFAPVVIQATEISAPPQSAPTFAQPEPPPLMTLPAEAPSRRAATGPAQAKMVGKAPARPKPPRRRGVVAGPLAFVAALGLTAAAILFREPIVAEVRDLAGIYKLAGLGVNVRGLEFREVTAARSLENGAPVLIVAGEVTNISRRDVDLPAIRLALRASGAQEVYAWSVDLAENSLTAGDSVGFRTRVASPPDARDLELRFADLKAGN